MGGFKFTGLAAGSATGNSLRYEQLFTTSAVALLGAMDWVKGADIASATTTNLTTATGNAVHITGTTTITAVTLGSGMWRLVVFDGALTLTHHATNNNLPGGVNITTVAGDRAIYWADGTTTYCISYIPVTVTGTGSAVLATSPTFVTPLLGTPTSGTLTNCTGLPTSGLSDATAPTTWTPTDQSGAALSLTVNDAYYMRIGKMVTVVFNITYPNTADGSAAKIGGLPFNPKALSGADQIYYVVISTNITSIVAILANSGAAATLTFAAPGTLGTPTVNSSLSTNTIKGIFTYIAN